MPFLNVKVSVPLSEEKKDELQKVLLKGVEASLHKPSSYIMMTIEDKASLYFGGQKMDKCAYVEVTLYGDSGRSSYNELCGYITKVLTEYVNIPQNAIYVSFHPTENFGFNGRLF